MILAEKIMKLRKQQGWSQEELASRLDVTRQSVSKWESMASMPDLDKIMKLSQVFGVSTDYLLKDDAAEEGAALEPAEETAPAASQERTVTLEEANTFLRLTERGSLRIAIGVALCILSPALLLLLDGLSGLPGSAIREAAANGVGVTALLLMVAAAVAMFIITEMQLDKYSYLEKEPIATEYGIAGIAERKKETYEPIFRRNLVLGVSLCILSAVPVVLFSTMDGSGMAGVLSVDLLLAFVAAGVFLFVRSGMVRGSYQKLLEEGDYTREKKLNNKRNAALAGVYWCVVTAGYLAWSFVTFHWEYTWIVWPVAGVLYAAVEGIANAIRKK